MNTRVPQIACNGTPPTWPPPGVPSGSCSDSCVRKQQEGEGM